MLNQITGLLVCFVLYIISIFIFAWIYHRLYEKRPQRFFFIKDILRGKREEKENQLSDKIQDLKPEIEVLQHLVKELERGNDIDHLVTQKQSLTLPSGNRYRVSKRIEYDGNLIQPGSVMTEITIIELHIQDSLGHTVKTLMLENPYYDKFKWNLQQGEKKLARYQQQLKTLEKDSSALWSYWDFFYFSASTQTTLGYGDILPNSSLVRRLVMGQVFFGLTILVLLINFVILLFQ